MNEQELLELGVSKEVAAKVAVASTKEIESVRTQASSELSTLKAQVTEREGQITELKKFKGSQEELQKKIADLESENKTKSVEFEKKLSTERKKNAVRSALLSDPAGKPFDADLVIQMVDLEKVSVDENGKIVGGFKEQVETVRKDKAFLFAKPGEAFDPHGAPPRDGVTPPAAPKPGEKKTEIGEFFLNEWEKERGIKKV